MHIISTNFDVGINISIRMVCTCCIVFLSYHWDKRKCNEAITQGAKTIGSTSIRHRSDTFRYERYQIGVEPMDFALGATARNYRRQDGADAAARFEKFLPARASLRPLISLEFTTEKHGGMVHLVPKR